jgi:hypothetical protein
MRLPISETYLAAAPRMCELFEPAAVLRESHVLTVFQYKPACLDPLGNRDEGRCRQAAGSPEVLSGGPALRHV